MFPVIMARPIAPLNRTQGIVLVFFMLVWVALLAIVALAPDTFDQPLKQLPFAQGRTVELAFVGSISIFLIILSIGVVRRWRWVFWLMLDRLRKWSSTASRVGTRAHRGHRFTGPGVVRGLSGRNRRCPICDRAGHAARLSARRHLGRVLGPASKVNQVRGLHRSSWLSVPQGQEHETFVLHGTPAQRGRLALRPAS
jgi:hypothetical protein